MKVLILGANGMLGQAMVNVWSDHTVMPMDLPQIDISDPVQIRQLLPNIRPDVVINCAAYTNVDACEEHEDLADRVNGTAVGYLAKACDALRVPLVHISTDYVFDGTKQHGYREDERPENPVSAYGRTKLHGERQLQLHAERHYLVRTSWLYGPGGKNFVQTMLELGKTKSELQVVNDQHGKPTYTYDLAGFVKQLVLDRAPFGVYHGVNEEPTTWFEFAKDIFRQAGVQTSVVPTTSEKFPRPAKRPAWSILLNTKRPLLRLWREALHDYLQEIGYPA